MRHLALALVALGAIAHPALAVTPEEVSTGLAHARAGMHDAAVHLQGQVRAGAKLVASDAQVQVLREPAVRRIQFLAPSAMAGNIVVLEPGSVSTYLALTGQVKHGKAMPAGAPVDVARLGGLMDGEFDAARFDVAGTEVTPQGEAVLLKEKAEGAHFEVWILTKEWRPHRMRLVNARGLTQLDWTVVDYKLNTGLKAQALRQLPKDAMDAEP